MANLGDTDRLYLYDESGTKTGDYRMIKDAQARSFVEGKMARYVMKLVKNDDDSYQLTDIDDNVLSFTDVYETTKKLNEYVVVIYGNSKLRPQYVSTNEMMFIGLDRNTESKVLRLLFTPTIITYETFKLMESNGDINFDGENINLVASNRVSLNESPMFTKKSFRVTETIGGQGDTEYKSIDVTTDGYKPISVGFSCDTANAIPSRLSIEPNNDKIFYTIRNLSSSEITVNLDLYVYYVRSELF